MCCSWSVFMFSFFFFVFAFWSLQSLCLALLFGRERHSDLIYRIFIYLLSYFLFWCLLLLFHLYLVKISWFPILKKWLTLSRFAYIFLESWIVIVIGCVVICWNWNVVCVVLIWLEFSCLGNHLNCDNLMFCKCF